MILKNVCLIILFFILLQNFDEVYCRRVVCPFSNPENTAIDSTKPYGVVYAKFGEPLELPCCQKYLTASENIWFVRSRFFLDWDDVRDDGNFGIESYDSFFWSSDQIWLIPTVTERSAKSYFCKQGILSEPDNNTFVFFVNVENPTRKVSHGKIDSFLNYKTQFLDPLSLLLSSPQNLILKNILSKLGLGLRAEFKWDDEWSKCDADNKMQSRSGRCHIVSQILDRNVCYKAGELCGLYSESLQIECSMVWSVIEISPALADRTKLITDFNVSIPCVGKKNYEIGQKRIGRYVLEVGDSLALDCLPYGRQSTDCHWRWNGIKISTNYDDTRTSMAVNEFCVLYIKNVLRSDHGNFSCFSDGQLRKQTLVFVEEARQAIAAMWWRHVQYLLFVIFLCLIILLGGLTVSYVQREIFDKVDPQNTLVRYAGKKFEFERLLPSN